MNKKYLFGLIHIYEYGFKKTHDSIDTTWHKNMSIKIGKLELIWRFY